MGKLYVGRWKNKKKPIIRRRSTDNGFTNQVESALLLVLNLLEAQEPARATCISRNTGFGEAQIELLIICTQNLINILTGISLVR